MIALAGGPEGLNAHVESAVSELDDLLRLFTQASPYSWSAAQDDQDPVKPLAISGQHQLCISTQALLRKSGLFQGTEAVQMSEHNYVSSQPFRSNLQHPAGKLIAPTEFEVIVRSSHNPCSWALLA